MLEVIHSLGFRECEPFKVISFSLPFLCFSPFLLLPFRVNLLGEKMFSRGQLGELDLNM